MFKEISIKYLQIINSNLFIKYKFQEGIELLVNNNQKVDLEDFNLKQEEFLLKNREKIIENSKDWLERHNNYLLKFK